MGLRDMVDHSIGRSRESTVVDKKAHPKKNTMGQSGELGQGQFEQMKYAHEFVPGDEHEPLEVVITSEYNQQILFSLENFDPQYRENEGALPPKVHPVLLLHMSARTRSPSFKLASDMGSIFAKESVEFLNPARVGVMFRVTWRVLDAYEKRGHSYQAMGINIHDVNGQHLLRREMHSTLFVRNNPGTA
jgi:hypothetical protein